jgi:hypothetical protein
MIDNHVTKFGTYDDSRAASRPDNYKLWGKNTVNKKTPDKISRYEEYTI